MITLPTTKNKPKVENPRFLIIFGKPKSGKTTTVSQLESNLIIDLEGGSEFLECMNIQARTMEDLSQIASAISTKIKETGQKPYKHITIDNATRLEELSIPYALKLYQQTPMAKKRDGSLYNDDIRMLPNGGGYLYLRLALRKIVAIFKDLCDTLILVGHTKDKIINKDGKELSEMSLDLVGRVADIICGEADAIAYCYRNKNKTYFNFNGGDNMLVEARADHLRGKTIEIAEADENNKITTHWDKIFLPDKTNDL